MPNEFLLVNEERETELIHIVFNYYYNLFLRLEILLIILTQLS